MENKKKLILSLAVVLLILLTGVLSYLNGKYVNPTDFQIKNITYNDSHLPESFDDVTVMFISDLEYGTFFNKDRLDAFVDKINKVQADIVIFGGDMFDRDYSPVSQDISNLRTALKSIDAPLGKFAVLGDFDYTSEQRAALVRKLLYDAEFEMLQDNTITLHNGTSEVIYLAGFDYKDSSIDSSLAYSNISNDSFVITVIHGAKLAENLPNQISDITLSGHSHHMQINLALFVNNVEYPNTGNYGTGKYKLKNTLLYVSNGVGTTRDDFRIFSDPGVYYLKLNKN
ncbi:MAG: metallophosphoesterase [Erysipelotrichaceae bacterium]|nr:metallophosphoesterase [Erysipelotrichaceae bacterium]MBQ1303708.1 metallophosphoesterase [Erysipelotrichaceae bacterium]MBQ2213784.1 metallophosphoesterase [Erysipelotrichaceae bacterium]